MMKLFVVGESSPNPKDWVKESEFELILAPDAETALRMSSHPPGNPVCEVPMDRPLHLVAMTWESPANQPF
jgi:hypothetical protein